MLTLASQMQPGWNLGNTLDATGGETSWGNPLTTKEMIDAIAATGFKSIRIPITWKVGSGDAPDYTIDPGRMARVKELVDWSLDNGLIVIINLHHDSDWVGKMATQHAETVSRFKAYWTQITQTFADYPTETLLFESINEPRYSDDWGKNDPSYFAMLAELNDAFHTIVRGSGGRNATRPLWMPTLVCGSEQARMDELLRYLTELNDPYIMATVHYYGHYHFSVNVGGVTTFDTTVKNDIDALLARCVKTFIDNGIAVTVGEYGLLAFDRDINGVERGEVLKYFNYLTRAARSHDIPLFLWDNGQHFDRRALVWRNQSLIDTIIHNMTGSTAVAERDYIFLKKQSLITDTAIPLHLVDNALEGVYHGDTALKSPEDYSYADGTLTLTADFLLKLPSQPLGEVAQLHCKFSSGPDWVIRVKQYDTPVLKPAPKSSGELTIPVEYNGDELDTLEAFTLQDDRVTGNAGPDNWTPFQQRSRSYVIDYDGGTLLLTREFFNAAGNGAYKIRLHFLSGEKIEYTVLRNEEGIIGAADQAALQEAVQTPASAATRAPLAKPPETFAPAPARTPAADPSETPGIAEATGESDESGESEAPDTPGGNWFFKAWRHPAVKIGAGAVAGAAVAAGVLAGLFRKRK